jgi:hypothetical protein
MFYQIYKLRKSKKMKIAYSLKKNCILIFYVLC